MLGRERGRDIDASPVASCVSPTGDGTPSLGVSGQRSDHLSYLARCLVSELCLQVWPPGQPGVSLLDRAVILGLCDWILHWTAHLVKLNENPILGNTIWQSILKGLEIHVLYGLVIQCLGVDSNEIIRNKWIQETQHCIKAKHWKHLKYSIMELYPKLWLYLSMQLLKTIFSKNTEWKCPLYNTRQHQQAAKLHPHNVVKYVSVNAENKHIGIYQKVNKTECWLMWLVVIFTFSLSFLRILYISFTVSLHIVNV